MLNQDNDKSVFVWGHFGKKLETLDKERFILLAQANPKISLFRHYNIKTNKMIREIFALRTEFLSLDKSEQERLKKNYISKIDIIYSNIENESYLHQIFIEANKLMLGLGDGVSFGSLVTGQLERNTKHGKIVIPKEKVNIE